MRREIETATAVGGRCARRIALAVVLLLGATAPAMGQGGDAKTVQVEVGDNMRFTPSVIEARPGERLHVVLKGVGKIQALAHNFVVLKAGTDPKSFADKAGPATRESGAIPADMKGRVIVASPLARSGATAEATFAAPTQPGEYTFLCTFPGHLNLGMKGQLIVK